MKKLKVKASYNHHMEYRYDIQRIVEIFSFVVVQYFEEVE